jgi:hypothetical protein
LSGGFVLLQLHPLFGLGLRGTTRSFIAEWLANAL